MSAEDGLSPHTVRKSGVEDGPGALVVAGPQVADDPKKSARTNGPAIPDVATAGAAPTQAQHNAVVAALNLVLQVLRDTNQIVSP